MSLSTTGTIGKGYVQIYTGECKGKTTAALGLAFRAMGYQLKTYIGQFMKARECGELYAAKMVYPYIIIEQYGSGGFIHLKPAPDTGDIDFARRGMERANEAMLSGNYNIVVLDEIITACFFKLVTQDDILSLIDSKPDGLELILTGRYAPEKLINRADLVTEMKQVKHYFQQHIPARTGIEC